MKNLSWKHVSSITIFYYLPTYIIGMVLGTIWFTAPFLLLGDMYFCVPLTVMMSFSWAGFIGSIYCILRYFLGWALNRQYRQFSIRYKKGVDYKDVIYVGLWPTLMTLALVMPLKFVMGSLGYECIDGNALSDAVEVLTLIVDAILAVIFTKRLVENRASTIEYEPKS